MTDKNKKFDKDKMQLLQRIIGTYASHVSAKNDDVNAVIDGLSALVFLEPDHDCESCAVKIHKAMQIIVGWEIDGFDPEHDAALKQASVELANYKLNGNSVN